MTLATLAPWKEKKGTSRFFMLPLRVTISTTISPSLSEEERASMYTGRLWLDGEEEEEGGKERKG
jgi:hypothetical protein